MLPLALLLGCVDVSSAGQVQHIPRQTFSSVAAITGIATTQEGLGLGGVSVTLQALAPGQSVTTVNVTAITNGDGSFRFLNLAPGRYQVKATRDGFLPFAQGDINLAAGDVFPLMFTLAAPPGGSDGMREIPRQPDLGPKPPPGPQQPATSSTYRNLPIAASSRR